MEERQVRQMCAALGITYRPAFDQDGHPGVVLTWDELETVHYGTDWA